MKRRDPYVLTEEMIRQMRDEIAIRLTRASLATDCASGRCRRMWCRRKGQCRRRLAAERAFPGVGWPQVRPPRQSRKEPRNGL